MTLPTNYAWLSKEPGPKALIQALALHGIRETAGPRNTPQIMEWAREIGGEVGKVFNADSIPWCGLFVAICQHRAGKELPSHPLWARAWLAWGKPNKVAELGDVLVFGRDGGGHVGFYVGDDHDCYHVLGGNQSDGVNIKRIPKGRCLGIRNSYNTKPANVRRVLASASGAPVSVSEA